LIVENARRRATKAVMAKICPSSRPVSRSAWMSAGVVAFGSLAESVRNFVRRGGRQERFRRSQGVA